MKVGRMVIVRGDYVEKILSRGLLALYLGILIWFVLFKLDFNILRVFHYHHRSLSLIPFDDHGSISEIIGNVFIFIPYGLLLNVNFKKVGFLPKFVLILACSLTFESIQYVFAIGSTSTTDVITNTVGGFLGLKLYSLSNQYIHNGTLDRIILSVGTLLLVTLLYYRIHILHINY